MAVVGGLPWQINTSSYWPWQLRMLTESRRGRVWMCGVALGACKDSSEHGPEGYMITGQQFCFIEVYVQRRMGFVAQFGTWHWKMRPRLLSLLGKDFFHLPAVLFFPNPWAFILPLCYVSVRAKNSNIWFSLRIYFILFYLFSQLTIYLIRWIICSFP